ncbi:MAG: hypothetical protein AAF962_26610 [Actinomycetota bacterium]
MRTPPDAARTRLAVAAVVLPFALAACGGGPSADAGDDFSVILGEAPEFDGCGSSGDLISYTWTIVAAPADMSEDVGKVLRQSIGECSFTLESTMEVADVGEWTIELLATDGVTESTDTVTVTVTEG